MAGKQVALLAGKHPEQRLCVHIAQIRMRGGVMPPTQGMQNIAFGKANPRTPEPNKRSSDLITSSSNVLRNVGDESGLKC